MIRKISIAAVFVCALIMNADGVYSQISFGNPEKINKEWYFTLHNTEDKPVQSFESGNWQKVELPHDWSIRQQLSPTLASATGYLPGGIGWYGKMLHVPEDKKGKKVYLYFEGVYNRSEVFVNGQPVGNRPNGYVSFMYDITPYIQYGCNNIVTVRVDHSRDADSRWYTGSGIYRNVWLVYANPLHIAQWGVFAYPVMGKNRGTLNVEVEVENGTDIQHSVTVVNELYAPDGEKTGQSSDKILLAAGRNGKVNAEIKISKPLLWSLDNPSLYTLKTKVLSDGKEIDYTETKTGFRQFTFDPDKGFALNGRWMKMKGVCLHHDAGVLGAAVPREVWKQRLLTLKEIGCNAIRTTHNPQAPDLYELCDELGLLVLNEAFDEWEFPKRKWLEGWNVGTPGFQGAYDFFEEWGERDLADMVRRDRNHVSVFAWSIGNEVDYPNDPYSHPVLDGTRDETGFNQPIFGGYRKDAPDAMRLGDIARRLAAIVRKYDTSRPVTAGLAGVAMSNETEYPGILDIAGYNYTESFYHSDHVKYPKRVIYGSENGHGMDAWKAVRDNEHIFGQFLWTGIDYLGESGRWPSRGLYVGLVDFGGLIKPRGYFRQSLWSDKPMMYVGTYPVRGGRRYLSQDAWPVWNYEEGDSIRVVCYTNASGVRLELNGRVAGETKDYDDNTGIIFWDLPYKAGKLEAVGLDMDGKEVCRNEIQTSKRPEKIAVIEAPEKISWDDGFARIVLQIVDEDGVPVMISDEEIICRIDGPAKLLGLESGSNQDMSDYTDNRHRVFYGRLVVYIQAIDGTGDINVSFSSPWLRSANVKIIKTSHL